MMIGYDIYERFTMEHFLLCQSIILTTSFFLLATVDSMYGCQANKKKCLALTDFSKTNLKKY
jgi:hypothetical protein